MSRFHNINGVDVQFTPEEEAVRDAEEAAWLAGVTKRTAQAELTRLEGEVTNRRIRDAINGTEYPVGWMAAQEALIAAERAKL